MDDRVAQFDELVRRVIEGSVTEDEFARLTGLLREDSALQKRYSLQMQVHTLLTFHRGQVWPEENSSDAAGLPVFQNIPVSRRADWRRRVALVAVLLGGALIAAVSTMERVFDRAGSPSVAAPSARFPSSDLSTSSRKESAQKISEERSNKALPPLQGSLIVLDSPNDATTRSKETSSANEKREISGDLLGTALASRAPAKKQEKQEMPMKTQENKTGVVRSSGKPSGWTKWKTLQASVLSATLGVLSGSAGTVTTFLGANGSDWFDAGNWDHGVPTAVDTAVIGSGRTARIDSGSAVAYETRISDGSGDGTLLITGGTLSSTNLVVGAAADRLGTLTQTGGTVYTHSLHVAYDGPGLNGVYDVSGGITRIVGTASELLRLYVGVDGSLGTLRIGAGGEVSSDSSKADMFVDGAGSELSFNGGNLVLRYVQIGTVSGPAKLVIDAADSVCNAVSVLSCYSADVRVSSGTLSSSVVRLASTGTASVTSACRFEIYGSLPTFAFGKTFALGTNNTLRVMLDEGGASCVHMSVGGGTCNMAGTLEIGRVGAGTKVPDSVRLLQTPGTVVGTFDTVIWKDGLTGDVSYDTPSEVWLTNIKEKPTGTVLYLF